MAAAQRKSVQQLALEQLSSLVEVAPGPPAGSPAAVLRVIEEPLLRLVSVDLGATADITNLAEVFDFAKDYLGLLKAAIIAAGRLPIRARDLFSD